MAWWAFYLTKIARDKGLGTWIQRRLIRRFLEIRCKQINIEKSLCNPLISIRFNPCRPRVLIPVTFITPSDTGIRILDSSLSSLMSMNPQSQESLEVNVRDSRTRIHRECLTDLYTTSWSHITACHIPFQSFSHHKRPKNIQKHIRILHIHTYILSKQLHPPHYHPIPCKGCTTYAFVGETFPVTFLTIPWNDWQVATILASVQEEELWSKSQCCHRL